jgi:hypothetical protein
LGSSKKRLKKVLLDVACTIISLHTAIEKRCDMKTPDVFIFVSGFTGPLNALESFSVALVSDFGPPKGKRE